MIDVTNCDLRKIVQEAYILSKPQGMGFIHFQPGPLSEEEITGILERFKDTTNTAVSMDYIKGRAVKLTVIKQGTRLYINDDWYDHSSGEYTLLLQRIGAERKAA